MSEPNVNLPKYKQSPPPQTEQITEREQIRQIWRPLYDLGYKGHEQIDAQYMAMLISQAVTETQALLTASNRELLERLFQNEQAVFHTIDKPTKEQRRIHDGLQEIYKIELRKLGDHEKGT